MNPKALIQYFVFSLFFITSSSYAQHVIDFNTSENQREISADAINAHEIPAHVSIQEFKIDYSFTNNQVDIGDIILFDIEGFDANEGKITYKNTDVNNVTSYICKFEDHPFSQVFISVNNHEYSITMDIPEQQRKFKTIASDNRSRYYFVELDPDNLGILGCGDVSTESKANLAEDHNPSILDQNPSPQKNEAIEDDKSDFDLSQKTAKPCPGPDNIANIQVLVVYTPAALAYSGSQASMDNDIAQAMTRANNASANSNLSMNFNLAHSELINYVESPEGSGNDLGRLIGKTDGFMDSVHSLRDTHEADFVHLITNVTDTGGIARLLRYKDGFDSGAFGITRIQQLDFTDTFIHEIGHNMGSSHSKFQNFQAGPTPWAYWTDNTWSAGWRYEASNFSYYSTLMTYENSQYWTDGISSTSISYFSTPLISVQGQPIGDTVDGDNARSLKEIKHVVSKYRSAETLEYCRASGEGASNLNLYISNVDLNDLSNASTWSNYKDNTCKSTSLIKNMSYPLTIDVAGSFNGAEMRVWVDWNNDSDFEDVGEEVYSSGQGSTLQYTTDITPPDSAFEGEVRMRIRYEVTSQDTFFQAPCGESTFGEVEDYTLEILEDLSLSENTFGANFSIYPNPTKEGRFSIKTPQLSGEVSLKLYNLIGQQLKAKELPVSNQQIDVDIPELASGMYIVQIAQGKESFSSKLIVK